jgi:hypothetical protein
MLASFFPEFSLSFFSLPSSSRIALLPFYRVLSQFFFLVPLAFLLRPFSFFLSSFFPHSIAPFLPRTFSVFLSSFFYCFLSTAYFLSFSSSFSSCRLFPSHSFIISSFLLSFLWSFSSFPRINPTPDRHHQINCFFCVFFFAFVFAYAPHACMHSHSFSDIDHTRHTHTHTHTHTHNLRRRMIWSCPTTSCTTLSKPRGCWRATPRCCVCRHGTLSPRWRCTACGVCVCVLRLCVPFQCCQRYAVVCRCGRHAKRGKAAQEGSEEEKEVEDIPKRKERENSARLEEEKEEFSAPYYRVQSRKRKKKGGEEEECTILQSAK